jgi:hypothetical protein
MAAVGLLTSNEFGVATAQPGAAAHAKPQTRGSADQVFRNLLFESASRSS